MRLQPLAALVLLAVLSVGSARAGTVSVGPTYSVVPGPPLGGFTITVSINSKDPTPPGPGTQDSIDQIGVHMAEFGPPALEENYILASDLPAGSSFIQFASGGGGGVKFGPNTLS